MEDSIAIVGVGCRFPGAHGPLEYWDLLLRGESQQRKFPKSDDDSLKIRWNFDHFFHASAENPGTATHRTVTFLDDIDKFDYEFFRLSPKESSEMDPQHRILLETCYEALEDSGMSLDDLQRPNNNIGVYVGSYAGDWNTMASLDLSEINNYSILGRPLFMISNRISHWFNFRGPSMTIDTACSSSLTGVHLAVQSLQRKECRMALCCGANILLHPNISVLLSRQDVFSKDGYLRAFDKDASGYVRGEGFGCIILKPLADALADGDRVYSVIKGSILSSGGKTKIITAPSVNAEAQMMKKALDIAQLEKDNIYYLEAHGTGTLVGDATELKAIIKAYEPQDRSNETSSFNKLRIGSVKSLIGHLEPASGVASLIKMSLCLYYSRLTPNANFREPNQNIDFVTNNLSVQTTVEPMPTDKPIRVGVNSFGIGGTLGHIILETPPPNNSFVDWRSSVEKGGLATWTLTSNAEAVGSKDSYFPFSAGSKAALKLLLIKWKNLILANSSSASTTINVENAKDLASEFLHIDASLVGHTLAFKKSHLPYRVLLVANSSSSFLKELDSGIEFAENPSRNVLQKGKKQRASVCFIFPGQGPQCLWMGTELFQTQPVFRETALKIDKILERKLGYSLIEKMELFKGLKTTTENFIQHPAYCQTAIFMFQVGLVELLSSCGINPTACIGHSAGEVASSWCAGLLTLEEAIDVVIARAATMGGLNETGGMLVLQCGKAVAEEICEKTKPGFIEIAAYNSNYSATLSGAPEELARARKIAESMGVTATMMRTTTPYHSSAVQKFEEIMVKHLSELNKNPRKEEDQERRSISLYSSILGRKFVVGQDRCDLDYWWKNTREAVYFHDACLALHNGSDDIDYFIEVANHPSIGSIVLDVYKEVFPSANPLKALNCVSRDKSDVDTFKQFLKNAYAYGSELDWLKIQQETSKSHLSNVRLPLYPWNHDTSLWAETKTSENYRQGKITTSSSLSNVGKSLSLDINTDAFLADHVINGKVIFPAAGYLITALRSFYAEKYSSQSSSLLCLRDALFQFPLVLGKEKPSELCLQWPDEIGNKYTFSSENNQRVYSEGYAETMDANTFKEILKERYEDEVVPFEWPTESENFLSSTEVYKILHKFGLHYGPKFQNITKLVSGSGRALAELKGSSDHQLFDIALLDACFQVTSFVTCDSSITYIPHGVKNFVYLKELKLGQSCEVEVRARGKNEYEKMSFDILVWQDKEVILVLLDFFVAPLAQDNQNINYEWQTIYQAINAQKVEFALTNTSVQPEFPSIDDETSRYSLYKVSKFIEENPKDETDTPFSRFRNAIISHQESVNKDNFEDLKSKPEPQENVYLSKLENILLSPNKTKLFETKENTKDSFPSSLVINSTNKLIELIKNFSSEFSVIRVAIVIPTDNISILENLATVLENTTQFWRHLEFVIYYLEADGPPKANAEILDILQNNGIISRCEPLSANPKAFDINDFHIVYSVGLTRSVDLELVVKFISQLLLPNGVFFSTEVTKLGLLGLVETASGLDWWRYATPRNAVLSEEEWNSTLSQNGFVQTKTTEIYSNELFHTASFIVSRLNVESKVKGTYSIFGNYSAAIEAVSKDISSENEVKSLTQSSSQFEQELTNAKCDKDGVLVYLYKTEFSTTDKSIDELTTTMETLKHLLQGNETKIVLVLFGTDPTAFGIAGLCRALNYESSIRLSLLWIKDTTEKFDFISQTLLNRLYINQSELIYSSGLWQVPKIVKAIPLELNKEVLNNEDFNLEVPILGINRPPMISESFYGQYPLLPEKPGKSFVRIKVKSIGLNFKHVMILLGMLPGYVLENAGGECTGIIESVGDEELAAKYGLKPGMEVIAFLEGSGLGTTVDAMMDFTLPLPKSLTFESGATVPLVFCTAYLGLIKMANLKKGETVLIHSAAGGVGLSAVQLANMVGATVIASCSSASKRQALREEFGVQHFVNSRSLAFEQEVMDITKGKGVSVVLNSLSGEFMEASFRCLEFGGRFIEIGKKDGLAGGKISLKVLMEGNIQLLNCHLDMIMKHQDKMRELFVEVISLFGEEKLKALPFTSYDLLECQEQMKIMAQGNHIGKIVLSVGKGLSKKNVNNDVNNVNSEKNDSILRKPSQLRRLRPDGTYLITGGVGSVGLALAEQMVKCGARQIVLCGRNGPNTYWQKSCVFKMRKLGVDVIFEKLDVSNEDQTRAVVQKYKNTLRGVAHVAGILDDGMLSSMTREKFKTVFGPKVVGAMNLHTTTVESNCKLDFFLMTSSIVAAMGNVGQANYVTANFYLTGIMNLRRSMGLNASVVELGAVKGEFGSGMIQDSFLQDNLSSRGLLFLSVTQAALGHVDMMIPTNWNNHRVFAAVKWTTTGCPGNVIRRFTHLSTTLWKVSSSGSADSASRKNLARKKIRQEVSNILSLNIKDIDSDMPLANFGLDSLGSVQIIRFLKDEMGIVATQFDILGDASIDSLLERLPENTDLVENTEEVVEEIEEVNPTQTGIMSLDASVEIRNPAANTAIVSKSIIQNQEDFGVKVAQEHYDFAFFPEYLARTVEEKTFRAKGLTHIPYHVQHDDYISGTTRINGVEFIDFTSYNYLSLANDPEVAEFTSAAVHKYGTSVSASRFASGQRPIHKIFEQELSEFIGTEDSLVFSAGFMAISSVISTVAKNKKDLIFFDSLIHRSAIEGVNTSDAQQKYFPHNNHKYIFDFLAKNRNKYEKVLIVIEGVYSMDGDIPDLPKFIEIRNTFKCILMIDEAHSLGVIGKTGRGIGEYFNVPAQDVDIWAGTLSKSFASCGGYCSGKKELIEFLRNQCAGFIFSAGITPANTAASICALRKMKSEQWRFEQLRENSEYFLKTAKEYGFDTLTSKDTAIVPIHIGDMSKALFICDALFANHINVIPIGYPAVAKGQERIRFFITRGHTAEQIKRTIHVLSEIIKKIS